jgi:hypothetical protein
MEGIVRMYLGLSEERAGAMSGRSSRERWAKAGRRPQAASPEGERAAAPFLQRREGRGARREAD